MSVNILIESDKRLALGIYRLRKAVGSLSDLATQEKGSLVAALNELAEKAGAGGSDEEAVNRLIDAKLDGLSGGASSAYDTLKEIEDALKGGDTAVQAILSEIAQLKQRDAELAQSLTLSQDWADKIDRLMTTGSEA